MRLEIMDTTLRDGEQTSGVSFSDQEKLSIAKLLLEEVKADRLEVASARVSEGEFASVKRICDWAGKLGYLDKIEVLGFIDGNISIDWIFDAGCRVINLLAKGSYKHVTQQLRKTPEEHVADIKKSINYAESKGVAVNLYLEDWSNGMLHSKKYVYYLLYNLKNENIKVFMLPDTLGILNHNQVYSFIKELVDRYPEMHIDFHAHNDYDLSVANTFEAIKAGAKGIHTTVNGLGERAGNAPLASIMGIVNDHLDIETSLVEFKINKVSKMVETFSGIRIPANKPIVGDFVFTQCAGIHADGDQKNKLYYNDLLPERFGRTREYALGKTSGKANIKNNLDELGIELDVNDMKLVTERIIELGDKKEHVTKEDLPYIIADVLENSRGERNIEFEAYSLALSKGLKPVASIKIRHYGKVYEAVSSGDGQYDAFMKALWQIYGKLKLSHPVLLDYNVSIPPGGHTDALVEAIIKWEFNGREFKTRGVDVDQTEAAIKATSKMVNIIEQWR